MEWEEGQTQKLGEHRVQKWVTNLAKIISLVGRRIIRKDEPTNWKKEWSRSFEFLNET